jgi:hypothetical protein
MNILDWALIFYGITATACGTCAASIGVWGLVKKRPFIFASHQLMWLILAMFIPSIIILFKILFVERRHTSLFTTSTSVFQVALMLLMIFVFWRQISGYTILGTSDETFREALIYAVNKLNLPYQETISKIKLTSLNADLQVNVFSSTGTSQIHIKQRQHVRYTKDIASAMDEYYKSNPVKVNDFIFSVYFFLGILMIAFLIAFALSILSYV